MKTLNDAVKTAENVARQIFSQVSDIMSAVHVKKERLYLRRYSGKYCLIIQKRNIGLDSFRIYDVEEDIIYCAREYGQGKEMSYKLINDQKKTVGTIKKKNVAVHLPLFHKNKLDAYKIEIGGQGVATVGKDPDSQEECYKVTPFGWTIKSSSGMKNYSVYDGWRKIIHISARSGYDYPTFIMDYDDSHYEEIGVLIALLLICKTLEKKQRNHQAQGKEK